MRFLLTLAACSCLLGQGIPIYTNVGPLSCGLRLYSPGQVQEYCLYAPTGATPVTICNAVHQITPVAVGQSIPVAASQSCMATDPNAGQNYEVTWLVFEPIVALPSNSTGSVQYQIATTQQACTVATSGACIANAGAAPIAGLQSGSFSSGVQGVADLVNIQVGSLPGVTLATTNHAPWYFASSPGPPSISVLSTDGWAYAVGDFGACTVTSSGTGLAEFVRTKEGVKVAWYPDGWCVGGLALSPVTIAGACSQLGLTARYPPPAGKQFLPRFDAIGPCGAVPAESSAFLLDAVMSSAPETPVIQGQ